MRAYRNMDGFDGVAPFGDGLYDARAIASHLDISLVHLYTKYVYSPRSAFPRGRRQSDKVGRRWSGPVRRSTRGWTAGSVRRPRPSWHGRRAPQEASALEDSGSPAARPSPHGSESGKGACSDAQGQSEGYGLGVSAR